MCRALGNVGNVSFFLLLQADEVRNIKSLALPVEKIHLKNEKKKSKFEHMVFRITTSVFGSKLATFQPNWFEHGLPTCTK